jgi:hypothetical protein
MRTDQRHVEAEGSSKVSGSASPWRHQLRIWRNRSACTSAGAVSHRRVAGAAEPGRMEVEDKERCVRPG